MPRRSFRSELTSLLFAFQTKAVIIQNPVGNNIRNDFQLTLQYNRLRRQRKYLLWGLLIGRSVDSFLKFFLPLKLRTHRQYDTFNKRIRRICSNRNPLTTNPTIKNDLDTVRKLRNDLFHNSGRHFTPDETRKYLFSSIRALVQLINDI